VEDEAVRRVVETRLVGKPLNGQVPDPRRASRPAKKKRRAPFLEAALFEFLCVRSD